MMRLFVYMSVCFGLDYLFCLLILSNAGSESLVIPLTILVINN